MVFSSLQTNQLSDAALHWYGDLLVASSDANWRGQMRFFAHDAVLQANNRLPAHGHAAIIAVLEDYWSRFHGLRFEPINLLGHDNHFATEMLIHYTFADGRISTVPGCGVLSRNRSGQVQTLHLFANVAPVLA